MNVTVNASELATLVKDAEAWRKTQQKIDIKVGQSPLYWFVAILRQADLFAVTYSNGQGGVELRHSVTGRTCFLPSVLLEEDRSKR